MSELRIRRFWGLFVVLGLAAFASAYAQSSGDCLSVALPDPIALPDGSIHPAGQLTLCTSRVYSPVSAVHALSLDGMPVARLLSRPGISEVPGPNQPTVTFYRDGGGILHLIGYAFRSGNRSRTYLLDTPSRRAGGMASGAAPLLGEAGFVAARAE